MAAFAGFTDNDFKGIAGTTWRGRDALGGMLAADLRHSVGPDTRSWGVRRRPELHIARSSHYDFAEPRSYAKLFVYTWGNDCEDGDEEDGDELAYGLFVEGKRDDDANYPHWRNFRERLRTSDGLSAALFAAMEEHRLIVADYNQRYNRYNRGGALGDQFRSHRGAFQSSPPGKPAWRDCSREDMIDRLISMQGEHEWIDLHVFAQMDKAAAVKLGPEVVKPVLLVLESLVPVYRAMIASPTA